MTYKQFYKKIEEYFKTNQFNLTPRGPVIHDGFPGNFNLSLTEYEFLNQNKNFMELKKDIIYSKIQPCIRFNDLENIQKQDENSYRYLLRFSMASVGNIYWEKDSTQRAKRSKETIKNTIGFLTNECGLDPKKLHIQYLKKGSVKKLTEGKYILNKMIDTDPNLNAYKELGIPEKNFIPVQNRDGLLSLNIYGRPTPWGYRNEIFYEYRGKLLDIATVENLTMKPIYDKSDQLTDLVEYPHTLALGAIGVERVLMILNNYKSVDELDIINIPALELSSCLDPKTAALFVQVLRAVLFIIADGGYYNTLDKRRKEKMRHFMTILSKTIQNKKIPEEIIEKCISSISKTEPYLTDLETTRARTIYEIKLYTLKEKYKQRWHEHLEEIAS